MAEKEKRREARESSSQAIRKKAVVVVADTEDGGCDCLHQQRRRGQVRMGPLGMRMPPSPGCVGSRSQEDGKGALQRWWQNSSLSGGAIVMP